MMRLRALLLSISLCPVLTAASLAQTAGPVATSQAGATQPGSPQDGNSAAPPHTALPQTGLLFDPAQLPAFHGKVAEYSLSPRGGPDGLILDDGSQVAVDRRFSAQLAALVKPGDAVTIHGVRAQSGSLILALSIGNDASSKTLTSEPRRDMRSAPMVAQGKIKGLLRNRRDEVDGAWLEDGSQIRLWPGEARRLAGLLTPGQTIYASGFGDDSLLGKVVVPRRIGTTEADATELRRPPFRFMSFHGMPGRGEEMDGYMRRGGDEMRRGQMDMRMRPDGGMERPMGPAAGPPGGAPAP